MLNNWLPDFRALAASGDFDIVDDYCDKHAQSYDSLRDDVSPEVSFYCSLIDPTTARIAELGCGTGSLSIPLAGSSRYYLALDSSDDMLEILRRKVKDSGAALPIEIRRCDFLDFPRPDDMPFDLVCIPYNGLVHVKSRARQRRLFRRIARSLKPGGYLVIDVWIPIVRIGKITHRLSLIKANSEEWVSYSQECFPHGHRRIADILLIPLNIAQRPMITAISEYVFTRSELRGLFGFADLRVSCLPSSHPIIKNEHRRVVYIGRRSCPVPRSLLCDK